MSEIRFVNAPLVCHYAPIETNQEAYEREFQSMSEYEEDAIGQWLKIAKAKGETSESDQVLLTLLVELHKKIDRLTEIVKDEEKLLLSLPLQTEIDAIGFEHIHLEEERLEQGVHYYMRIQMPLFPKREIPVFIEGIDTKIAKLIRIHDKDEKDWNAYVAARERVMIREAKGKQRV